MKKRIVRWYKKWFLDSYTVYCERTPFYTKFTQTPVVFYVRGLWNAEGTMWSWVEKHPWGKASILQGFQMVGDEHNAT